MHLQAVRLLHLIIVPVACSALMSVVCLQDAQRLPHPSIAVLC